MQVLSLWLSQTPHDFGACLTWLVWLEGDEYNAAHGNKWSLADLKLYIEAVHGTAAAQALFSDIEVGCVYCISCQNSLVKECEQLYTRQECMHVGTRGCMCTILTLCAAKPLPSSTSSIRGTCKSGLTI